MYHYSGTFILLPNVPFLPPKLLVQLVPLVKILVPILVPLLRQLRSQATSPRVKRPAARRSRKSQPTFCLRLTDCQRKLRLTGCQRRLRLTGCQRRLSPLDSGCQAPTLGLRGPPQSLSFPASGCLDLPLTPPDLDLDLDLDLHQDPDLSLARKSLLGSQFRLAKTFPGNDYWSLIGQ